MKRLFIFILGFILLAATVFCATASADTSLVLKVGIYENKPKIFTDDNGKPAGFWPDIVNYIADKEGWKIDWIHGTWAECLDRLQNNTIDIMPDVGYTTERDVIFDFSHEYVYVSWSRAFSREGIQIQSILDLEGKNVAVMDGSINYEGPDGIKTLTQAFNIHCTFIPLDSYIEVFEWLDKKQADVGVVSKDFAYNNAANYQVVETPIVFQPAHLYFAFPIDSTIKTSLTEKIDNDVREIKADTNSIFYHSLEKWFTTESIEKLVIPNWLMWLLIGIAILAALLGGGAFILRAQVRIRTKELAEDVAKREKIEKDLRESEEKLRLILETVPLGLVLTNTEGQILQANQSAIKLSGYNETELKDKKYRQLFTELDRPRVVASLTKTLNNGYIDTYEYTMRRKDGSEFPAEMCRSLVKDESGNIIGTVAVFENITRRLQAKEELEQSEKNYRELAESISDVFFAFDGELRYTYWNRASEKLTGIPAKDALGKHLFDIFPKDDQTKKAEAFYLKVLHTGQPLEFINEFQLGDKHLCFEISTYPAKDGLSVFAKDITERKRAEEKYRTILKTAVDGFFIIDLNAKLLEVNDSYCQMSGYTREELLKMSVPDIDVMYSPEGVTKRIGIMIKQGPDHFETRHRRKDGRIIDVEVSTNYLDIEQGQFFVFCHDITQKRKAEEEHRKVVEYRELDRLKTSLLSTVSHELRTPLASIKGYSSLLLMYDRKLDKAQKRESLEAIDRSTDRLTELIEHLLDMSRLDAGMLRLNMELVKPSDIFLAAITEAKMRAPKHKFINKVNRRLPVLNGDSKRLRQVIDNLLDNAIKYSSEGTTITVCAKVKADELLVNITDQGQGIADDEIPKIFDRFYRIEQRMAKDPGGMGLGLSLCNALVKAHGGRIWVESQLKIGSTFFFTVPLKKEKTDGSKK